MDCPHCLCTEPRRLKRTTDLGYAVFRCRGRDRTSNERTGTPFNFVDVPTEIVFQVLLFRVRYKLGYRDVAEMFLLRGFTFTHETVRDWEDRFAPLVAQELRAKRQGKAGKIGYVDETSVKVKGQWCYLYRAIDEASDLIDVRLRPYGSVA